MNLFELFVKIGAKDEASGTISKITSGLGKGLATAAKIGTAAVGAAATGIAALTKEAVNNYAEYEQLVGGVETLFKKSSDTVMKYAENAYKTAGMSANEYMETVTSFSASLLQSLDGDTAAAAEKANMAITDMSDNANKMGTSMEMIQNAYNGFAKQNYTMLDNLKLGYGGTKEEMQRLLDKANELNAQQGIITDYQINSYADVVDAIHVVQNEIGITGTTADEAGTTIQGSVASMKSAWTNLLTGLSDSNADIEQLVGNLVTTIVGDGTETNLGVLGNIMPAVQTALNGASTLISQALPEIMEIVPSIINDNLPILAEAAVSILQSLIDGISENQETLFDTIFGVITYLSESFITMLPQIVELGLDLIVSLANGITENTDELLPTIVDTVMKIGDELIENAPELINAGIELASAIMDGVLEQFDGLEPIIMAVVAAFGAYKAITLASEIASKGMAAAQWLVNAAMNANPITLIVMLIAGLVAAIITLWKTNDDFREAVIKAWEKVKGFISNAVDEISNFFTVTIPKAAETLVDWFKSIPEKIKEIGKQLIEGLWNGISDKVEWLKSKVSGVVDKIKSWFTGSDGFDTHSPSKWSEKVFKNVMDGGGNGLDDGLPSLIRTATGVTDSVKNALTMGDYSVPVRVSGTAYTSSQTTGGTAAELDSIRRDVSFIVSVLANGITLDANDRELGRFVKKYATA